MIEVISTTLKLKRDLKPSTHQMMVIFGLLFLLNGLSFSALALIPPPSPATSSDQPINADELASLRLFARAQTAYQQQAFQKTLAFALWARTAGPQNISSDTRDRWASLELLSLSRLCRWKEINDVWSKTKDPGPLSQKTIKLITLKTEYRSFLKDELNEPIGIFKRIEKAQTAWRLNPKELGRFSDPENLRIKMASQCQKATENLN